MPRDHDSPWGRWKNSGLTRSPMGILTFAEVNAIRQAWETGRFSKASLCRIYDIYPVAINRAIAGTYRYHRRK